MSSTPMMVLPMEPTPPKKLAPPMMTAAMASVS